VLSSSDPGCLEAAALALDAGGIVGIPTETVYGLAVLPRPDALAALILAKRRPLDKGIALLVDDVDQVASLVRLSPPARRLAERFWPGALTLVLPLRQGVVLPDELTGGRGSLGVRLPDHRVPRALARRMGPLAVTSANRSGEPEAATAGALLTAVGESLALVVDDGPVRGGVPSSVVSVAADGRLEVLRQGALRREDIEAAAWIGT
jgi:L-threonylcarbamoyladenylate synthase